MNSDHIDQQVTDTFRKLNAPHEKRSFSRFGIYISWASLLLLAGCLFVVALYVNELDQRSEQIRLHEVNQQRPLNNSFSTQGSCHCVVGLLSGAQQASAPLRLSITAFQQR